ncbi:annexin D4-like [Hordeum vulgare subsp. vulgare]|uniref:Annexin n=2 Tax=Hordeum vulgare subsp. vulgare TaxID=112509 RepID=A0A8I7BD08_HORVV|nr:annexin D4-like [Hordeum vulgare subsp. vulgare]
MVDACVRPSGIKASPMQQFLAAQASSNGSTAAAAAAPPASASPLRSRPPRREQPSQTTVKDKEATMADEHQELTKAFSGMGGLGVEETALVSALGRWRKQPEKRAQFRRGFPGFFTPAAAAGAGAIERCSDDYVSHLKTEFARFKSLMVLWAMHPWERDARWAHRALHKKHHPASVLVELACTRTADELLGARRAYHALYHRSLEEDVAYRVKDADANRLLVGLVSAYRYEGPRVDEGLAREEAAALAGAKAQSELVARVLATRSKPQLRATFRLYRELHGKPLEEEFGGEAPCLREAVRCLESPARYFGEVIDGAFKEGADKQAKAALTRVVVSRSDADMEEIKDAYLKHHGAKLVDAVAKNTHGHYRDALLAMIGK